VFKKIQRLRCNSLNLLNKIEIQSVLDIDIFLIHLSVMSVHIKQNHYMEPQCKTKENVNYFRTYVTMSYIIHVNS